MVRCYRHYLRASIKVAKFEYLQSEMIVKTK